MFCFFFPCPFCSNGNKCEIYLNRGILSLNFITRTKCTVKMHGEANFNAYFIFYHAKCNKTEGLKQNASN